MTAYSVTPQFGAPQPSTPLKIVKVLAPSQRQVSEFWINNGYPVRLQLSRPLTYHEDLLIGQSTGNWSPEGDQIVISSTKMELVAQNIDDYQHVVGRFEENALNRRNQEELQTETGRRIADEINARLGG